MKWEVNMNFYVGNKLKEINEQSFNIEFSDELINFIYKLSKKENSDMSYLYSIDPYADIEIPKENVIKIINICKYILEKSLLENYEEPNEGERMLKNLIEIAEKAIQKNAGLVSLGD